MAVVVSLLLWASCLPGYLGLNLQELVTDTGGYSNIVFGLFLRFGLRLADLGVLLNWVCYSTCCVVDDAVHECRTRLSA